MNILIKREMEKLFKKERKHPVFNWKTSCSIIIFDNGNGRICLANNRIVHQSKSKTVFKVPYISIYIYFIRLCSNFNFCRMGFKHFKLYSTYQQTRCPDKFLAKYASNIWLFIITNINLRIFNLSCRHVVYRKIQLYSLRFWYNWPKRKIINKYNKKKALLEGFFKMWSLMLWKELWNKKF